MAANPRFFSLLLCLSAAAPWPVEAAAPSAGDVAQVLEEVPAFRLDRLVPGVLRLDRERARALLLNNDRQVFGALGVSSGGRVVSFAHDAFLSAGRFLDEPALLRLALNSIRWAGGSDTPAVGVSPALTGLDAALQAGGMQVQKISPADLSRQVDVYCFDGQRALPAQDIDRIRKFLLKGGGLVLVATPWAFAKSFPDFHELPANQLGMLAGIEFLPEGTAQIQGTVSTRRTSPAEVLTAIRALQANPRADATLLEQLRGALLLEPADAGAVLPALAELDQALGPVIPCSAKPLIPEQDPLRLAVVEVRSGLNQSLPPALVPALPAATDFPGAVPGRALRVVRSVDVDGTWRGWLPGRSAAGWAAGEWRSTGLYAPPGEVIRVQVPQEMAGKGFDVVIGSYGGGLERRPQWNRYPRTQRSFSIDAPQSEAANGLGGLIYIRVPKDGKAGPGKVTVSGAVEAPWFRLGETPLETWRETIRTLPGPWAELAGHRVILTVPSESIRSLDDPETLMKTWDDLLDRAAELAAVDRSGYRQERLIFDRQTSAGSLHSGYPVAAHVGDDLTVALDPKRLKGEGSWGLFHEFGHNHQHDLWALPGTGETTCNLWSVYLFEEWVGRSRDTAHPEVHPLRRRQLRQSYFQKGRNFEADWNVFTALDCYLLIQEAFGWKPFQKVFAEYNTLPEIEWPRTQQEKNDQWVLRLSRACGANLVPYYRRWNLPVSPEVDAKVTDLPGWMPSGLPE